MMTEQDERLERAIEANRCPTCGEIAHAVDQDEETPSCQSCGWIDPFNQGIAAREAGSPERANPFPRGPRTMHDRDAWAAGWEQEDGDR